MTRVLTGGNLFSQIKQRRIRLVLILGLVFTAYLFFRTSDGSSSTTTAKSTKPIGLIITTPSNASFPFHYLPLSSKVSKTDFSNVQPVSINSIRNSDFYPTHILDELVVANEIDHGELLSIRLSELSSGKPSLKIVERVGSGGSAPAFILVTRDGKWLLCSNYNSPTVSLYSLSHSTGPDHITTHNFPLPQTASGIPPTSHPHQIIQHPQLEHVFYVPDLGLNTVHTIHLSKGLSSRQGAGLVSKSGTTSASGYYIDPKIGKGPRHGVVSPDGSTLFIAFQTTSTILPLALGPDGSLSRTNIPMKSIDVLPPTLLAQYPPPTRPEIFGLSDVQLSSDGTRIYVANRRIKPPYPPLIPGEIDGGGDTIAIYNIIKSSSAGSKSSHTIELDRHVSTGCYQPRELLSLETKDDEETLVITCVGGDGVGAGLVVIRLEDGKDKVLGRWESGGAGAWGVAPVRGD